MKTETGYIYPEGISAERKPTQNDFMICGGKYGYDEDLLLIALKEWEKTLIPVKNCFQGVMKDRWYITTVINEADYDQLITPGQKVRHNEGEITRIL